MPSRRGSSQSTSGRPSKNAKHGSLAVLLMAALVIYTVLHHAASMEWDSATGHFSVFNAPARHGPVAAHAAGVSVYHTRPWSYNCILYTRSYILLHFTSLSHRRALASAQLNTLSRATNYKQQTRSRSVSSTRAVGPGTHVC